MNIRAMLRKLALQEDLNFLLTNRVPRSALTHLMGWFSRIEHPLVCRWSIAIWQLFADLDLSDADSVCFRSLHDCFTRRLRDGARPLDHAADVLVSPCDAIVGACGPIEGALVLQAKGFPYSLDDLLLDPDLAAAHRDGTYVTLRLTSAMYHRFHAPADLHIERVTYVSGDTWNVNPIALRRVERLFCRNERAVIECRLEAGRLPLTLVPVAAILVASMRLTFIDVLLHLRYRGPNRMACDVHLAKGAEMGWFEHGSTIIVLVPPGYALCPEVRSGVTLRMGEPLLRLQRATHH